MFFCLIILSLFQLISISLENYNVKEPIYNIEETPDVTAITDYEDFTEELLCRCLLYFPSSNIFMYVKSNELFYARETLDDILKFKIYNMGLFINESIIFSDEYNNYKFCFTVISNIFMDSSEYVEIYLPWWLTTRWIKINEWPIEESCKPCLCTVPDLPYLWEIYETKEHLSWQHSSNGQIKTCTNYHLTRIVNVEGKISYWMKIKGYISNKRPKWA